MKNIIATAAPEPRSIMARNTAWTYAAILTIMVIAQLFSFEDFIPFFNDYQLPGGQGISTLAAGLIVTLEVFALPFLLRMRLSPLMRWTSLVCSVAVPLFWTALTFYGFWVNGAAGGGGLLGPKVEIPIILQLPILYILTILALYIAYGLGPIHKKS
jgi:hypothetical protein